MISALQSGHTVDFASLPPYIFASRIIHPSGQQHFVHLVVKVGAHRKLSVINNCWEYGRGAACPKKNVDSVSWENESNQRGFPMQGSPKSTSLGVSA